MIKIYFISLIVSMFLFILLDENVQKKRMAILIILYSVLFIMTFIGKKKFVSRKNEKLGLYLLYISTLFIPISFLLLDFAIDVTKTFKNFMFNLSILLIISLTLFILLIIVKKYGEKYLPDNILAYLLATPIFLVMFISLITTDEENITNMFIGVGACIEIMLVIQYKRIAIYFEQKNTDRYGESLDILSNLKEKKKK